MPNLGTIYMGNEQQSWKEALEEYMVESPNDWIAKWLYGGMDTGMWEESMYADILKEWYGELPGTYQGRRGPHPTWYSKAPSGMTPEPAWMSKMGLIAERGEDIQGPRIGWDETDYPWWDWRSKPIYATAPGTAETIRPLGAQANLTTEQLDQLLSYLAYTKGGKPESRESYLQTMAYKMPGWVQDYMSTSQSMWPTVAPPKARTGAAWQR